MPTGKRASMREGPLAALFRKTAEDAPATEQPEERSAAEHGAAEPAAGRAASAADEPAAPPRRARASHVPLAAGAPAPRLLRRHPREPARAPGGPSDAGAAADPFARPDARSRETFAPPEPVGCAGDPRGRRRRRRRQRRQPDGRGRDRGRRVPRDQHRPAVAPAVGRARDAPHRRLGHARARLGLRPRARPRGGARGVRPDQGDAARLGHGVHRRRRRRRHRHRRGADRRADRARARRADGRDRHAPVPVRGLAPARPGRGRDRGARRARSTR